MGLQSVVTPHLDASCYSLLPFEGKDCLKFLYTCSSPSSLACDWNFLKCSWCERIVYTFNLPLWPTGNIKAVPSSVDLFKVLTVVSAIDVSLLLGTVTLWIPGGKIKK